MSNAIEKLQIKSIELQKDIIRMIHKAASGHPGSSLSCIDIILTLFERIMKHDPKRPEWEDRDRFIISKGHGVPALYAVLADQGYFPKEELMTLRQVNSRLQGHPDRLRLPATEASTGSLGQGLSIGIGIAMASRLSKRNFNTYVLVGDGESEEGQIWEAIAFAGFHKIPNLTCIFDENGFQLDGSCESILSLIPYRPKLESFGWEVIDINGHNFSEIITALERSKETRDRPLAIVADTIKGKGVSFMENNNHFHGVPPTDEECAKALQELDQALARLKNRTGSLVR